MARSKRKRCLVHMCEAKIRPGTPFCKKHFGTHRVVMQKCNGEAHSNPYIDHCMVCMPHWGEYPVAMPKGSPLNERQREPQ
jgi:hypothetical protein